MLTIVDQRNHVLLNLLRDDPVRPHISADFRVSKNRFVMVLENTTPQSVVCVSLQEQVPRDESELGSDTDLPTVAVFYTIWSYQTGAGTQILFDTVEYIRKNYPLIQRFVTLSPKTRMADRFHRRNGANVFRENTDTINYEYLQKAA